MRIKVLVMMSLAVCSLSLSANAKSLRTTTKYAVCYPNFGINLCTVECGTGMVVVGGGCEIVPWTVGISASFPSGPSQWACRNAATARWMTVYAICQ